MSKPGGLERRATTDEDIAKHRPEELPERNPESSGGIGEGLVASDVQRA